MANKSENRHARKPSTKVPSQARRKSKSDRTPRPRNHGGRPLEFFHPVAVLRDRAWEAWRQVSGLDSLCELYDDLKFWDDYGEPAQRALGLACSATYNIGRWLRYGLRQRAGLFETEMRKALRELHSYVGFGMARHLSIEQARQRWEQNVTILEQLMSELDDASIDIREMDDWFDELRACRAALAAVDEGLGKLNSLAASASGVWTRQLDYVKSSIIPSFGERLLIVLPGILFAHDRECDGACLRVDDLPSRLQECAFDLGYWARSNAKTPATSKDNPFQRSDEFDATWIETKSFLDYLELILQAPLLADTFNAGELSCDNQPSKAADGAERVGGSTAPRRHKLNEMEQNVIDAIREWGRMTTEPLAKKAGYKISSTFKQTLAGMVRRGILANKIDDMGRGYELHPDFDPLSTDNSTDQGPD